MKDQISMWENEGGKPIKENGTTYADEILHKETETLDTKKLLDYLTWIEKSSAYKASHSAYGIVISEAFDDRRRAKTLIALIKSGVFNYEQD